MKNTIFFKYLMIILLAMSAQVVWAQTTGEKEMDVFITDLMKKMTLSEKLGQMSLLTPNARTGPFATKNINEKLKDATGGNIYAVIGTAATVHSKSAYADSTRLKIPLLNGLDIIHGYKTVFPIPLALSCSWDIPLIGQTARVAAIEATAAGYNWTFSPMVDLTRDPRWGRVMEGSGEDPYLGGKIAAAMVGGYQGKSLADETSLMACVKHFALYGAAEAGRDYNTTDMSSLTMYQNYLAPYKAAVEAGAGSIMSSFNDIDGVPATANKWLLTDVLRKQWGFNGFVVTDYNAIQEMINHGVAADYQQAAELALGAGVDMDMASESMVAGLPKSLKEGKVTMAEIDAACRRVLEAKYKLGLFTNPYRGFDLNNVTKVTLTTANKEVAKKAALESMVLLQNKNGILPLNKNSHIALIGPFANNQQEMFSMWSFLGDVRSVVTIFDGLKKQNKNVTYTQGTQVSDDSLTNAKLRITYDRTRQQELVEAALQNAKSSDVVVVVLGESLNMAGEAKSRTDISIPSCQRELLRELKKTGKPVILLLSNGRPLTIQEDLKYTDAVIDIWHLGTEAGDAIADVLLGNYNPSGKLTMTFPRSVGQIPIYYNHKNTGRPYTEGKKEDYVSNYKDQYNTPLFPFGYGLSYTQFTYGEIMLSDTTISGTKKMLSARIKITNTGKYAGWETTQLYLWQPVASIARPVKELKNFKRTFLEPGESATIDFQITPEDLKFYNSALKYDWEPGMFKLYIGSSSQDVKETKFKWSK